MKSAAIYDVYYGCQSELTMYVVNLNGMPQEQKAALLDEMGAKGLNYAHKTVVEWHGADAVRATLMGLPPPPKAANRPVGF